MLPPSLHCPALWSRYEKQLHLPWSQHKTTDDKVLDCVDEFKNRQVVVTEKLDGENTSMYSDHYHARSLDSRNHPSRNFAKSLHGSIQHEIPKMVRKNHVQTSKFWMNEKIVPNKMTDLKK